ncbi:MAG: hypothetical protein M3R15_17980 [Acidobacteriota bacterium]|nr:hypothetical protein [Acidobacteriota bacterium]
MSTNKLKKAGKRAFPKAEDPKPALRLIRPSSECSTPDIKINATREVKEMLRDMNRKRNLVKESDAPEAA